MSAEHRESLAAELKRAFTCATAEQAKPGATVAAPEDAGGSISFTMPLLRAVMSGHKTQTRRPIRPAPATVVDGLPLDSSAHPIAPIYRPGERLWVREKWARAVDGEGERFAYAIDEPSLRVRWNSSRFMPRVAARRFLLVKRVEVARLGAIDDASAMLEGAAGDPSATMFGPRDWFMNAWDSIYGDGEFAGGNDPWVWVISFSLEA